MKKRPPTAVGGRFFGFFIEISIAVPTHPFPPAVEGLAEGADLVRQAEEEALPEPGEDQVHGEHVGGDHVPLDGSQGKIPPRVAQGEARVAEAVEPVTGVGVVPVIEEVVVEQRPPHQRPGVHPQSQRPGQTHAHHRRKKAVEGHAHVPVLAEALGQQHPLGAQNVPAIAADHRRRRFLVFHLGSCLSWCYQFSRPWAVQCSSRAFSSRQWGRMPSISP